jgi:DNA-binding transcriptional LysR family regulator
MRITCVPAASRYALDPAALDSHDCLTYLETAGPNQWVFAGSDGLMQQRVSGSFRANSGELLRVCALAGDGLIYQPTFLVGDDLRAGTLVQVLREFLPTPLGLYAVYPDRRHLPLRTRAFVDFLSQRFDNTPPWDRDLVQ